jgi:hypothetical protein
MANATGPELPQAMLEAAEAVAKKLRADIILFNKPISDDISSRFHTLLEKTPKRHDDVFVMLVTFGGDAHAAYVIARDLQQRYKRVIICIAGDCYSAGTLIVLCAHEIVITDRGRLGPLDIQILKRDELLEHVSGLTVTSALEELQQRSFETFYHYTLELKGRFGPQISFKTALDVASTITGHTYGEIYKQIDPIRLAEDARLLKIASHYGALLGKESGNLKSRAVDRLLEGYPSHECIIDRKEAVELFNNLRGPTDEETSLLSELGSLATDAVGHESRGAMIVFPEVTKRGESNESKKNDNEAPAKPASSRKPRSRGVSATGNGAARPSDATEVA